MERKDLIAHSTVIYPVINVRDLYLERMHIKRSSGIKYVNTAENVMMLFVGFKKINIWNNEKPWNSWLQESIANEIKKNRKYRTQ